MALYEILCIATIAVAVIVICGAVWHEFQLRRIMKNLNTMLDSAIGNTFMEHSFDESLLSATESKLADFLSASEISSRNISQEKDKIKELISDISHQTKTPIANILLYSQLLAEQPLPEDSQKCINALSGQAEKLRFLIDSLVKLSRLESGIVSLQPVLSPLNTVLRELAEQFTPKAEQKGISITVEDSSAHAVFDPRWTTEALGNIIDNAIKYTPTGGAVCVSVTEYELFCRIDVQDTGMGIAEGEQSKVFSRFYRSPAVGNQEGVGIGLYLTRQILTGQGGYIKLSSESGKGSTFSAFLPRQNENLQNC